MSHWPYKEPPDNGLVPMELQVCVQVKVNKLMMERGYDVTWSHDLGPNWQWYRTATKSITLSMGSMINHILTVTVREACYEAEGECRVLIDTEKFDLHEDLTFEYICDEIERVFLNSKWFREK